MKPHQSFARGLIFPLGLALIPMALIHLGVGIADVCCAAQSAAVGWPAASAAGGVMVIVTLLQVRTAVSGLRTSIGL